MNRTGTVGYRASAPTVTAGTAVPRSLWRELHAADPDAVPTQTPEWLDCLTAMGGYQDATRLYEMPDGRRAILPLVRRSYPRGGPAVLQSMPKAWGYGGLIAPDGVTSDLVSAVLDDLSAAPALRVHILPNPLHATAWAQAVAGRPGIIAVASRAHDLDLDGGFERVWRERFKGATRTHVRHTEKEASPSKPTRRVGSYRSSTVRCCARSNGWAQQQHEPAWLAQLRGRRRDPLNKFTTIAERMGDGCHVSVAWFEDQPAAATIVLRGGANAHYTRGAMDETLNARTNANCLLHKVAIEDACRSGCRKYHMGESGSSAGLARFKGRFGAQVYDYAEYWIERLPVYRADHALRTGVKRVIGFQDAKDV